MVSLTIGQIAAIAGPTGQTYRNWIHRKPLRLNETDPGGKWRRFGFADVVRLVAMGRLTRLGMDPDAAVEILNEQFDMIEDVAARFADGGARRGLLRNDRPIIVAGTAGPHRSRAFAHFGDYVARLVHGRCEPTELVIDVYDLVKTAHVGATSDAAHDPGNVVE